MTTLYLYTGILNIIIWISCLLYLKKIKNKELFLNKINHEIRNQITILLNLIAINKNDLTPIKKVGEKIQHLINDLIDMSKMGNNKFTINEISFSLPELFKEIQEQLNNSAIIFTSQNEDLIDIIADRMRLQQILINLITNAHKAGENKSIHIEYSLNKNKDHILFRIIDEGKGVDPKMQKNLFQPFSSSSGNGLGLVLSQNLARMMGGDLILEKSEENKGSTFLLSITYHSIKEYQNKKILLVDDSVEICELMKRLLSKRGFSQVEVAFNGLMAMDKVAKDHFDLIIIDMQMPIMDGYQTIHELRKKGYHLPIFAITAHASSEEEKKCLASGANYYFVKPFDWSKLTNTLLKEFKNS